MLKETLEECYILPVSNICQWASGLILSTFPLPLFSISGVAQRHSKSPEDTSRRLTARSASHVLSGLVPDTPSPLWPLWLTAPVWAADLPVLRALQGSLFPRLGLRSWGLPDVGPCLSHQGFRVGTPAPDVLTPRTILSPKCWPPTPLGLKFPPVPVFCLKEQRAVLT